MNKTTILSLFSGAGGLDLGFHLEGFQIKACIEIEQDACETLKLNKGKYLDKDTKIYCEDITKLDPRSVLDEIGEVDFMIGGPPCQSFSAAGRRAGGVFGVNDTRGSLFWFYAQYLKVFKPKGFLFENVKGILQANKSQDWEIIKQSFREIGYKLSFSVVDAADFGVPQHRERVIMVGQKMNTPFRFPRPIYGHNSKEKKPYITPREVFKDIDDPSEIVPTYSGKYGHLLADIPPGLNYSHYTERMGHGSPLFAWRSKFSGFLYKLDPDEPSKTLVAHQGKYDGPFHWKNRKLNKNELIRIQGFPIDYDFFGKKASIEKQIGNSVAPKLAKVLAMCVAKQLFEKKVEIDLLQPNEVLKRKLRSRIKESDAYIKKSQSNIYQLDLFREKIKGDNEKVVLDKHAKSFVNKCTLVDGKWQINAKKTSSSNAVIVTINLSFSNVISGKFNKIHCELRTDDPLDFNIAWDFIHDLINYSCSYENLQPLYGHFTEPYPKFTVDTNINNTNAAIRSIMKMMSDYSFIGKTHKYEELSEIGSTDIIALVKLLRDKGVDIRIHETNRAIPKGYFKICYPFCTPSWQRTYTKWIDIGNHKTSDVDIKNIMGSLSQ